jgi:hypothetical protein
MASILPKPARLELCGLCQIAVFLPAGTAKHVARLIHIKPRIDPGKKLS